MSEVAGFHLGSHANTYQSTRGSHCDPFSLGEHGQSQRDMGHLSLQLSLSLQSGFFGLCWKSAYINTMGHLPNTWSLPFGYTQIFELPRAVHLFSHLIVMI